MRGDSTAAKKTDTQSKCNTKKNKKSSKKIITTTRKETNIKNNNKGEGIKPVSTCIVICSMHAYPV